MISKIKEEESLSLLIVIRNMRICGIDDYQ